MSENKFLEIERIYTLAKSDEAYLKDMCSDGDENAFDCAYMCSERLSKFKRKYAKKMNYIIEEQKRKYSQTNDPEVIKSLFERIESTYKTFFETVMVFLKKGYMKF